MPNREPLYPLTFRLGKETYTLSAGALARMRQAMDKTTTRELGFALLGNITNLMPGVEQVGDIEGMRVDVSGTKGFFHTHPDGNPELSPDDWGHTIIASGKLGFPFLECSGANGDVYCTTVDDIDKLTIPKEPTDEELDELVQHLVKPYHFSVEVNKMTKRAPLYPHTPKKKEPQFPHRPGSTPPEPLAREIYTPSELADIAKIFLETTGIKTATVFAGLHPMYTRWQDLTQSERDQTIEGLRVRIEREGLLGYLERKRPAAGDELTNSIIAQLTAKGYLSSPEEIDSLAKTEGNPISKYCCRQCGDCAPEALLEEGKFLERISWLRRHYQEKHPGIWGKG